MSGPPGSDEDPLSASGLEAAAQMVPARSPARAALTLARSAEMSGAPKEVVVALLAPLVRAVADLAGPARTPCRPMGGEPAGPLTDEERRGMREMACAMAVTALRLAGSVLSGGFAACAVLLYQARTMQECDQALGWMRGAVEAWLEETGRPPL